MTGHSDFTATAKKQDGRIARIGRITATAF
jgi:hypothetical protein